MNRTATADGCSQKFGVSDKELAIMLGCGKETAVKIAIDAGARVKYGRRVIYFVPKVEEYLRSLADQQCSEG